MKAFLDWKHITFAHPYFFALLLVIPFMIWWQSRGRKNSQPVLRITTLGGIKPLPPGAKARFRPVMFILRVLALLMLIIGLARPQSTNTTVNNDTDGIDLVLGMDISGSMLAEDFRPNRMEAAKKVALDFVDKRPSDRIGLVIFSGESFTMCPITIDHQVLKEQIMNLKSGMVTDGTAIGDGLATSVDKLRYSKAKSKVIILMTDGENNCGKISPLTALEIAKVYKLKVYTIGVGTQGQALIPMQTPMGTVKQMMPVNIDEPLLRQIAGQTGGKYFRATSNNSLKTIYEEIDRMEKTSIEVTSFKRYAELFFPFALLAALFLSLELLLRYTLFKSLT